jgi:hypothetical protein
MFGHPAFTMSVAHERHQALIAEADRRRLLAIAREARKARKARRRLADAAGYVAAPGRSEARAGAGSTVRDDGSLARCREHVAAPAR